jgi:hypothetical protein
MALRSIISFFYEWAQNTPQKRIQHELEIAEKTAMLWARTCRSIAAFYFESLNKEGMIGGPGTILEVDETLVAKRKFNVGRLVEQQWLFGGILRSTPGAKFECFLELVSDRSRPTLHGVLKRRVRQGTYICSDSWAAYGDLTVLGFGNGKVNHSLHFVNPNDRNVHTQSIESLWGHLKKQLRQKCAFNRDYLDEYICEFLYRKTFPDVFESLLLHTALMFQTGQ